MLKNDFIITKIEKIIYFDDTKLKVPYSDFTCELPANEIYFNISGKSTTHFHDTVFKSGSSNAVFLPKGPCKKYEVFREEYGTGIDVFFQTDIPISNIPLVLNPSAKNKIQSLFQKAFYVWTSKKQGYYYKTLSILYEIFSELQKTNYIPEKKYKLIEPAVEYMERNFTNPDFCYTELAELCGISYSYFKRLFIEKFGIPPQKYVTQLRINYACDLLSSNLYNITQIAELVGISDIYYFSKIFKEYTGVSPSKFVYKSELS